MPKLSLCMIVRNESAHLDTCLDNIKNIVDEIIIVDTGSDDDTKDIALHHNAHVLDLEWTDDFSKARNHALCQATGDWILVLDADETISLSDHHHLAKLLDNRDADAYSLTQRTYGSKLRHASYVYRGTDSYKESRSYTGWIASNLVRLFRNKPNYRFRYRIHEVIEPSIVSSGGSICHCKIPIHHYNYERDEKQIEAKLMRYIKLGLLQIEDTPSDPKPYLEVSQVYLQFDRYPDAERILDNAVAISPANPDIYDLLSTLYLHTNRPTEAQQALEKGLTYRPNDIEMLNKMASASLAIGTFKAAGEILDRTLILAPNSVKTLNNLGLLFAVTNRNTEAIKAFQNTLRINPHNEYALTSLGMIHIKTKQFAAAKKFLERAHAINSDDPRILYHLAITCHKLGNKKPAIQMLKRAQAIKPGDPAISAYLKKLC